MGAKTKIDWCDSSWNPVTGCRHGCEYCYAKRYADRFGYMADDHRLHELNAPIVKESHVVGVKDAKQPYPYSFAPTFHRYKLDEIQHWKRPRTIFVCSMADLFGDWVPLAWIQEVFEACRKAPQHRYLFLAKNPGRYMSLAKLEQLPTEDNFWFGTSTPKKDMPYFFGEGVNTFVSIEPLHERFHYIGAAEPDELPNWIIVGAETGNRRGRIIPEKEWVDEIARFAQGNGIPVFMKESLRTIMGDDFKQDFPWGSSNGIL